jgi:hypothetical protein
VDRDAGEYHVEALITDVNRPQPVQAITTTAATNGQAVLVTTPCRMWATISAAGMGSKYGASIP